MAYDTARARETSLFVPLNAVSTPQASIAVDSHDRPHVTALTGLSGDLSYLSLNSNEWLVQTVVSDVENASTPLAIDKQDNPHIAYLSRTSDHVMHAFYDGTTWQLEDTGFAMMPSSVKIAQDGTVNIAEVVGTAEVCEESGLNAIWSNNCFDFNNGGKVFLAFGANGSPEAAYIALAGSAITLATFDGSNWASTPIINASSLELSYIKDLAFATDSAGFGNLVFVGSRGKSAILFSAHQQSGGTWAMTSLGGGNSIGFAGLALDLDRAGLPHLVFTPFTDIGNFVAYAAETLPALNVQWESVTSVVKAGKTTITGTLQVTNFGTAVAAGFTVNYYLSADDQLDASDTLVGHSALALGAGQTKTMKFSFAKAGHLPMSI